MSRRPSYPIRLFLPLLTILLLLSACKKYPDGPYFSLSSRENRIAGDWLVEQAISADQFDVTATYAGYTFTFGQDSLVRIAYPDGSGNIDTLGARWYLTGNNEVFRWLLDSRPEGFPFDSAAIFDIARLTNNQFWIWDGNYTELRLGGI